MMSLDGSRTGLWLLAIRVGDWVGSFSLSAISVTGMGLVRVEDERLPELRLPMTGPSFKDPCPLVMVPVCSSRDPREFLESFKMP